MARSCSLARPRRATLSTWFGAGCLVLIWAGSTLQIWLLNGQPREALTFFLAGVGFTITMIVRGWRPGHRHTVTDRQRLDVLAAMCAAAFIAASVIQYVWGGEMPGVPVILSLAGVLTITHAGRGTGHRRAQRHAGRRLIDALRHGVRTGLGAAGNQPPHALGHPPPDRRAVGREDLRVLAHRRQLHPHLHPASLATWNGSAAARTSPSPDPRAATDDL